MPPVRLTVTGGTIEGAWWGTPDGGPTLVLLHEGLGCVALWKDFPAQLAAATGRPVFAWSRLGYGQSDPVPLPRPITYMHAEAALLPAVLDAAGIGDAVLLGHSDGASIALIHAGTAPDPRLRGLVLIAPHIFVEDVTIAGIEAARDAFRHGGLRPRLARYHRDVDATFTGWNDAWLDPGFRAWDIQDRLPGVQVPVLALQGTADEYGTPAQLDGIALQVAGPAQRALIPDAKHAPHLSHGPAVLAQVAPWICNILQETVA